MNKRIFTACILLLVSSFSFSQNIGIGIPTPTKAKFEVAGVSGVGNTNAVFGSTSSGISLQQNYPTIGFNQYRDNTVGNGRYMANGYAAIQYMDPGGGGMYIDMLGNGSANTLTGSGVRALSIQSNGHVGILGDASAATLTVSRGAGSFDGTARFNGSVNPSFFNYGADENTYIRSGKDGSTVVINDVNNGIIRLGGTDGRVGINTYNGNYTLTIRQTLINNVDKGLMFESNQFSQQWELRNRANFYFIVNGVIKSYIDDSNGSYNIFSDKRLKKNFQELPSILNKVMLLHPLQYEIINDPAKSGLHTGFIAQEVKTLFPDLVNVIKDSHDATGYKGITDLHSLDYNGFGVLAIKAIQEQQVLIAALQKKVEALEQKLK